MLQLEPETRDLDVKLTPDEVQAKSEELARVVDEIVTIEEEKAKVVRTFSVTLKDKKRRLRELARNVTKQEEMRPVMVFHRPDLRRFVIESYRGDNSEVVGSRAMTKQELEEARQSQLFDDRGTHVPTRVATAASSLPLSSPPQETVVPAIEVNGAVAVGAVGAEPSDGTEITAPDDLLNGKQAKKAAKAEKAATKKRRGGLTIGTEEMPPATPGAIVGAATIIHETCTATMHAGDKIVRCALPPGHPIEQAHHNDGIAWTDDAPEAILAGSPPVQP